MQKPKMFAQMDKVVSWINAKLKLNKYREEKERWIFLQIPSIVTRFLAVIISVVKEMTFAY